MICAPAICCSGLARNPFDLLISNSAIKFFPTLQGVGETLAGFHGLFSSRVGSGRQQRVSVLGQLNHIITNRSCLSVHIFCFRNWMLRKHCRSFRLPP